MKKFIFFALVSALFFACSSDNDDNGMSDVRADMVDMHVIGVDVKSIVTDDGVSLPFAPMKLADKYSRVDTTYRALMYYTMKKEENIEIISTSLAILLKPVETTAITRTDAVGWQSTWISKNRKYLNLTLGFLVGGVADLDLNKRLAFRIGNVKDNEAGGKVYEMTLMCDLSGVQQYYTDVRYISVPISNFNSNDEIELHIKTYEGNAVRKIKLSEESKL